MKLVTCNNRDTLRVDKQIEYLNPEKEAPHQHQQK